MLSLDGQGVVIGFNAACEQMLGFQSHEVIGHLPGERLLPERNKNVVAAELARLAAGERTEYLGTSRPIAMLRADGSELDVEVSAEQMASDPDVFTCVLRDLEQTTAAARGAALIGTVGQLEDVGTFEWDVTSGAGRMSVAMRQMHGLPPDALERGFEAYLDLVHERDRGELIAGVMAMRVENRMSPITAWRIVRPDGQVRRLMGSVAPLAWDGGRLVRVMGTVRDVTDRWLAERELELHTAVSQALAAWEAPDGGAVGLLERMVGASEWGCGTLWTVRTGDRMLTRRAVWCDPSRPQNAPDEDSPRKGYPRGEGLPGRAWAAGDPLSSWELEQNGWRAQAEDAQGRLALPVFADGRLLGVLEFVDAHHGPIDEGLRRCLQAIGQQLGDFFSRHRGELGDSPVSKRELEVLYMASLGGTTASIALELSVSASTVKTHFENIYVKLGVRDRAAAVAEALRRGLIS